MQTRDEVEGLHNRREFSQPLECLYQAMQTQEQSFLLLLYLPLKTTTGEKIKIHFTDQNVSPYNINLTIAFHNRPIKTLINQNLN